MKVQKAAWTRPDTNNFVISIITSSIPDGAYGNIHKIRAFLKKIKRAGEAVLKPLPTYLESPYGGHPGVTRSLIEGLQKLNVSFNYNPALVKDLSRTVIVLSDAFALKQMIALKQQGYIKYLLAGPNILNDPGSHNGILSSSEVDICITPCERVCKLHERFLPSLAGRCLPWAAGVDTEYWKPIENGARSHILIYSKQNKGETESVEKYVSILEERGYQVTTIHYGSYSVEQFRNYLQTAICMVGFSRDESQGIAWAEAWACDVPTFIWYCSEPTYLGVEYKGISAPYLTDETGYFFSSTEDFVELLDKWKNNKMVLKPREWCLKNMSDEVCATELLRLSQVL